MWSRLKSWFQSPKTPSFADVEVTQGAVDQTLFLRSALVALLADRRAERRSRTARAVLYFVMFALPAVGYLAFAARSAGFRIGPGGDVVAVVRLEGEMADGATASAATVIPALRKAFESDRIKGVVLSIDSPGGAPLEAERIYTAVESLRKVHPKPLVAVINNLGASAAYMVAIHADRIYAGNYSLVGSVGAILSGWDAHDALNRLGVSQRVYASGELKSMMNPYVAMSPEADRKARDLVTAMGKTFRSQVTLQRKGKLAEGFDVSSGEVWSGAEAQRLGLVDEVATIDQVIQSRWPELRTRDLGPHSGGLPFASASADWLGQALAVAAARLQATGIAVR